MYGVRFGTVVTLVQGRLQDCDANRTGQCLFNLNFRDHLTLTGHLKHTWGVVGTW